VERPDLAPPPPLGEVLEFLRLLWEVDHALQRASKRMAVRFGVTGPQRLVIRIVGRFPGIPAGQLAAILRIHPSTVTDIVQRLERRGLVQRTRDARDGRRVLLGLTEQGRNVDAQHSGTVEGAVKQALGQVSPLELRGARAALTALGIALQQAAEGLASGASGPPARARPAERALAR
jgi:DNA-binding MarR family transcriptional regulator